MSYAKERMIQEWQQGWKFVPDDRFVCANCFEDEAIKEFIETHAVEKKRSYCRRRSKKPIAAPMNDILELIGDSIRSEFGHPDNEGVPVEGGEYVFPIKSTYEVLDSVGPVTENEEVFEEILDSFSDSFWVDKPFLRLSEDDELRYGWEDFVKAVKHRTRYVFFRTRKKKSSSHSDTIPPSEMLDRIGKVMNEVDLVRQMKAATRWFRARVHGTSEILTSATDLGTVPQTKAHFPNRMSPSGIPMFYGCGDEATAMAESYTPRPGRPQAVSVGIFELARDIWVLDLTDLPDVPSLFDEDRRHLRSGISFLHDFVEDLTKPITKDGRGHIEYVPTQIITEYIRHVFKPEARQKIKGILYRSAQNGEGVCCVLFFRNKHCCDAVPGWQEDKNKWLGLVDTTRHEFK